ncbi:MAG: DUF4258 domain-containing protein [Thermoplasmata archaeon]|nr:DUF4258 domain-containing protein [Thermoplasmata archaeon]
MFCKFRPTAHAKHRMIERGISRDKAIETILKGIKRHKDDKIFARLRGIEVLYIQKSCNYHVITIY